MGYCHTYPSRASLINHGEFAQVLWYLLFFYFRHRLHTLEVAISGVTPEDKGKARGQSGKSKEMSGISSTLSTALKSRPGSPTQ